MGRRFKPRKFMTHYGVGRLFFSGFNLRPILFSIFNLIGLISIVIQTRRMSHSECGLIGINLPLHKIISNKKCRGQKTPSWRSGDRGINSQCQGEYSWVKFCWGRTMASTRWRACRTGRLRAVHWPTSRSASGRTGTGSSRWSPSRRTGSSHSHTFWTN